MNTVCTRVRPSIASTIGSKMRQNADAAVTTFDEVINATGETLDKLLKMIYSGDRLLEHRGAAPAVISRNF